MECIFNGKALDRKMLGLVTQQIWKIMKIMMFLLTVLALQVSARGFGQTITFGSDKKITVEEALNIITKQTGYSFIGEKDILNNAPTITLSLKKATLTDALNQCLKGLSLTYDIEGKIVVLIGRVVPTGRMTALANESAVEKPDTIINGRITDNTGKPLMAVTIQVKGTATGTITDVSGKFSLPAPNNAVLLISSLGYTQKEEPVNGRKIINVVLIPITTGLNQLVVVGYGVQKKLDLTGAVDQISGAQVQNRPVPNLSSALQGMMANLNVYTTGAGGQPDATKSLNIRGFTGLGVSAGPLVLVDGVPADINSVNPNDVESISMLKDIASAAIYGSRAPNGVLLITTKHGSKGQAMQINYDNNLSWTNPINNPQTMNSYDFANLYNEASVNAGTGMFFSQSYVSRILQYLLHPGSIPIVMPTADGGAWDVKNTGVANNDWYNILMKKNVLSQQHNISLEGGSEKVAYYVAGGVQSQDANLNFTNYYVYNRYNFRTNINADVTKWLTFGMETSFAQTNDKVPYANDIGYNWYYEVTRMWPTWPLYAPNGGYDIGYLPTGMSPYRYQSYQVNEGWLKGKVDIKPLQGWLIHGDYAYNYYAQNAQDYRGQTAPYSTPRNNHTIGPVVASFNRTATFNHYHNYNIYSSYERHIGVHYFQVLLGQQEEYQYYSNYSAYNTSLYDINSPSLNLSYGTPPRVGDYGAAWATFGTFGRVNYNYKEKYLLELNGRYMGTSLFPANTRYSFFKSASAGWNISKEAFFRPLSRAINNLKFRVSYGGTGDISYFLSGSGYYPYLANLGTKTPPQTTWLFSGPATDSRQPAITAPGLVSPTLTWAKPSMLDIGVDVDFLQDFGFVFDWYDKRISDLFGPPATYPSTLGTNPPQVNDATTQTRGFDLTLNWHHTYGELGLMARATLSNYNGKVLTYIGNSTNLLSTWYNGEQLGTIWGYKTVGKFQSQAKINAAPSQNFFSNKGWAPGDIQYADLNHDGVINNGTNTLQNHGDLMVIGNTTPQYQYGVTFGANYKGFDISVFMQGIGSGQYYTTSNTFWGTEGGGTSSPAYKTLADRWTPTNPNGYFPRQIFGSSQDMQAQSGYLLSLAYWRLKNLSFGYTFPRELIRKIHLSKARIYASVDNLATIAPELKHSYIDPEEISQGGQIYPLMKAVSVGVQVSIR